jgi:hypothetical protein
MVAAATDPPEIVIPMAGEETVEPPNGETPPEPKPFNKTQKDFDALNAVLAKERASHKEDHDARVTLEQAGASESERAWQAKVDAATNASDNRLKAVAARAALTTAGLQGSPTKLVALLDLTAVVVDDDGEVIGLEDQVKGLKEEYPGLFGATNGSAPKPGQVSTGSHKPVATKAKNWGEQVAEQMGLGRR